MKNTLRILALTLALTLLLGSVAFAEDNSQSVPATITNVIFSSKTDLDEAYADPELRGLVVGPLVLDTLLQSDVIDAETLLGMIENGKIYIAHNQIHYGENGENSVYSCYIYGKTGDFHVFFTYGGENFRAGYDAAPVSDPENLMKNLVAQGFIISYYEVPSVQALAAISALLDVLQNK